MKSTHALDGAFVRVHAYDYGAWGTLRVVATAQGKDDGLGRGAGRGPGRDR